MKTPKRILVVQAHPDDADYYTGGTIKKCIEKGATVTYLTLTSGNKGTRDRNLNSKKIAEIREAEQRKANKTLGVTNAIFLRHNDGELICDTALLEEVIRIVREFTPDTIITFDPDWPDGERHPDHHATTLTAVRGAAFSGFHLYFPDQIAEGLSPHHVDRILFMNARRPNRSIWIFPHFRGKLRAVLSHESQMKYILDDRQKKFTRWILKGAPSILAFFIFLFLDRSFIFERFREISGRAFLR
jgi:LmbE family N-acetylglucosaminyl deacetylase